MKHFYSTLPFSRSAKVFLLTTLFLGGSIASNGQIYKTILSGPAEAPPNNSPGTGTATITIDGTMMRIQTSFSGLIGTTTAAHIHAPTAIPGAGAAGVATTLPTFVGFPLGVTSGTYDRTLDMTLASSYNPNYIAANGGTIASAFAALKAALNNGTSYLNIHTTSFLGGEIRGFLILCPTITVTIPDAVALPEGVLPNTVYPAYAPASSITLTSTVSGGTGPFTYSWSNGSTASSITVSPAVTTTYTLTVSNQVGCTGTATKTVTVADVSGGNKDNKIVVCHKGGNALTIAGSAVAAHLAHGDLLGSCANGARSVKGREAVAEELTENLVVRALPNPSKNYFDIQLNGKAGNDVQLRVYDMLGRVVEAKTSLKTNQTLRVGSDYRPGIYMVEILQGGQRQTLRLVKEN